MGDRPRVPNLVLRRIRELERQETRSEFAEAMARKAEELGEAVSPSERYVARLEDGDVRYPHPAYRRVLTELCGRSTAELGFVSTNSQPAAGLLPISGTPRPSMLASQDQSLTSAALPGAAHDEWPTWFGIRLARLVALVHSWQGSVDEIDSLQALVHQEILMFDASAPEGDDFGSSSAHDLSRRQALLTLTALPVTFAVSNAASADTRDPATTKDFFLSQCAASLTASWHLLRGSDLSTIDHMLSTYLLPLEGVARHSSRYQKAAAGLASQAHRICGIIALHRNRLKVREHHCRQALRYASVASDPSIRASALVSLASTYFYNSEPARAAAVFEETSDVGVGMSPLQRARVYAELSVVYGQLNREQDAIRSAGLAEEIYPEQPEQDPSFLYAEFTPASLTLEQGLAYIALAEQDPGRGYQRKAGDIFARFESEMPADAPDRIRFEIINHQARTAVLLDDIDAYEIYAHRGLDGVITLGSRQRLKEMKSAWCDAMARWPRERRVAAFRERLQLPAGEATKEPT
jgi:tetratricopeptide (TPR) repeat protein